MFLAAAASLALLLTVNTSDAQMWTRRGWYNGYYGGYYPAYNYNYNYYRPYGYPVYPSYGYYGPTYYPGTSFYYSTPSYGFYIR
jgi:hypothetical protein